MTQNEIVSAIMNLVTSHEGVTNTSLSQDQVADEVHSLRSRMIAEIEGQSLFRRPYTGFNQKIEALQVKKEGAILYVDIPRMFMLRHHYPAFNYIGGKDKKSPYRVVTGSVHNALTDMFISKLPIAHYEEGRLTFYNCTPKEIRVEAVFQKPSDLEILGEYDADVDEYPMPLQLQDVLIGKTSNTYVNFMYRKPITPNTQSDLVQGR